MMSSGWIGIVHDADGGGGSAAGVRRDFGTGGGFWRRSGRVDSELLAVVMSLRRRSREFVQAPWFVHSSSLFVGTSRDI